jgi:hypothetical protein
VRLGLGFRLQALVPGTQAPGLISLDAGCPRLGVSTPDFSWQAKTRLVLAGCSTLLAMPECQDLPFGDTWMRGGECGQTIRHTSTF